MISFDFDISSSVVVVLCLNFVKADIRSISLSLISVDFGRNKILPLVEFWFYSDFLKSEALTAKIIYC